MARRKLWSTQNNLLRSERKSHMTTSSLLRMKKSVAYAQQRTVENISIKIPRTMFNGKKSQEESFKHGKRNNVVSPLLIYMLSLIFNKISFSNIKGGYHKCMYQIQCVQNAKKVTRREENAYYKWQDFRYCCKCKIHLNLF